MNNEILTKVKAVIQEAVLAFGSRAVDPGAGWSIETIAESIVRHSMRCKIDLSLALAQAWVECHFGVNPAARRSRKTLNIYNVGNVDSGADRRMESWDAGIAVYADLMRREYNHKDGADGYITLESMVKHDFKRPRGGRYASAVNYTRQVQTVAMRIRRKLS